MGSIIASPGPVAPPPNSRQQKKTEMWSGVLVRSGLVAMDHVN
jgi:hypothetical protein